jgi:ribonuclease HII
VKLFVVFGVTSRKWEQGRQALGYRSVAGIDEAGRGPLAGPVVAAACILSDDFELDGLTDSKRLTPRKRQVFFDIMERHCGIAYGIGLSTPLEIDKINILQATLLAMQRAVGALPMVPDYLLIDGNQCPVTPIPAMAIVKGDLESLSIAAASVIAKVTRDRIMVQLHQEYPEYHFHLHKGYPTKLHREILVKLGPSPCHRRSFLKKDSYSTWE